MGGGIEGEVVNMQQTVDHYHTDFSSFTVYVFKNLSCFPKYVYDEIHMLLRV